MYVMIATDAGLLRVFNGGAVAATKQENIFE